MKKYLNQQDIYKLMGVEALDEYESKEIFFTIDRIISKSWVSEYYLKYLEDETITVVGKISSDSCCDYYLVWDYRVDWQKVNSEESNEHPNLLVVRIDRTDCGNCCYAYDCTRETYSKVEFFNPLEWFNSYPTFTYHIMNNVAKEEKK